MTATAAFADPVPADNNVEPPAGSCAGYERLTGSYVWSGGTGQLDIDIELSAPACAEADYDLFVIRDWGPTGDVGPFMFDVEGPYADDPNDPNDDALLIEDPTLVNGNVLSYDVPIDDNDPTICVVSTSFASFTTENESVDDNGNGTTNDDLHNGNGGENNKDKDKFGWGSTTTTHSDRAPDTNCEPLNLIWETGTSGPSRGYN